MVICNRFIIFFLIPSFSAAYGELSEEVLSNVIALAYPILSSFQLVPAIIGIMYLSKKSTNLVWMLFLFGFIIISVGDTLYLFAELDGSYYDGHLSDLLFIYSYVMFLFAIYFRSKIGNKLKSNDDTIFFSEKIQFETISKFGIPLTVAIICIIILTSLFNTVIIQPEEQTFYSKSYAWSCSNVGSFRCNCNYYQQESFTFSSNEN